MTLRRSMRLRSRASSGSSLEALPEELVGVIYSLLDSESKKAFLCSSPIVSNAPSVLEQVTKLIIPLSHLPFHESNGNQDPSQYPLYFPCRAQLRELVFRGVLGYDTGLDGRYLDETGLILQLLQAQNEGMRAKLRQVTRVHLKDCSTTTVSDGRLGAFLRSLPRLQALSFDDFLVPCSHAALFSSLAEPMADGALCLKELHCHKFDAQSIQAVSHLTSLESLSMEFVEECELHPKVLQPFSSLTALRHLSMEYVGGDSNEDGLEIVLPHLGSLTLLRIRSLHTYHLAAMPTSLRRLELGCPNANVLCNCLEHLVQGAGSILPSLCQLHLRTLDLFNFNIQSDSVYELQEIGARISSHLAALPSLLLTIGELWTVSRLRHFFALFKPLSQHAQGLTTFVIDDDYVDWASRKISPDDLAGLAKLCPNIKKLSAEGCIQLASLQASLTEIFRGYQQLSCLEFIVDIMDEPRYESFLIDFCKALTYDQRRGTQVSLIQVTVFLQAGDLSGDDFDTEDKDSLEEEAMSLEQAWRQISASLPGKALEVSLKVERFCPD